MPAAHGEALPCPKCLETLPLYPGQRPERLCKYSCLLCSGANKEERNASLSGVDVRGLACPGWGPRLGRACSHRRRKGETSITVVIFVRHEISVLRPDEPAARATMR